MSISGDISWENILVGSSSHHIYKELNNDVEGTSYNNYCSEFNNSKDNTDNANYNLCKKIARNADRLSNYFNTIEYITQCAHYKYWTYLNIKKNLGDNTNDDKAKPITEKFLQSQNKFKDNFNAYYCQYDFKTDIVQRLNNMVEEKYLYDYFHNYDSIKTSDTCKVVTPDKYENYLKYIITLYNKRKEEDECCYGSFLIDCEDYFKCDEEFDPNQLLSTLKSNESKKCDNLIKAQKPPTSGSITHWGHSLTNITGSIYYIKCTDIPNEEITHATQEGGIRNCHVFRTSDNSHIMPLSPSLQATSVIGPFTTYGQRGISVSTKLLRDNSISRGNKEQSSQSSSLQQSHVPEDNSSDKNSPCKNPLLSRDTSGKCIEPDVRKTNTIGVKLDVFAPGKKIKIRLNPNSYMFKNKIFRGGIAFTLIMGIMFTIFLFYKFTPFGRCFHKKVSRKKRIDDYYEDPYMRQFIIRAPKSDKRRTGNRGLQFSYYTR
ncbi:PIR protein [Plasmodium malariae]|uniref:PIR protein n=1 Tax=Plasmodium malariae TaxID=5858 RepID=A0A1D3JIT0_PLAMA|nr:PIR protein [Plasmodium malariae]SBT86398.1 PIR protein [Plasmodium malariae]